jgi:plastocyanin
MILSMPGGSRRYTCAIALVAIAATACDEPAATTPAPPPIAPIAPPPVATQPDARRGYDDTLFAGIPGGTIAGQVLDSAQRAAPDVVVYVKKGPAPTGGRAAPAVMDQKDKTFLPHVLPVAVGTRVEFKNSDPVLHNVYSRVATKTFDLGMFGNTDTKTAVFDKLGRVDVFCAIHTNMHAVILVLADPRFATTDARGFFRIPDLPPGAYTLGVWDELTAEREVTVEVRAGEPAVVKHQLVEG